jgi:hypothetical protein
MSGLVPFIRIGRAVRFSVTDLDAAIDRMTVNPIQPVVNPGQTSNHTHGHDLV